MSETEEEVILYLEFNNMLHEDVLQGPNVQFKVIGFDTDKPIFQIGEEVYEGEYKDAYGTNVIFEEDTNHVPGDEVFGRDVPKHIRYLCKTNKIISMSRIFVTEKNAEPEVESTPAKPKFAETYQEALSKLSECGVISDITPDINQKWENK